MFAFPIGVSAAQTGASVYIFDDLAGGGVFSVAEAISGDGSVVVGASESANGTEAFIWSNSTGMMALGDLPGQDYYTWAFGVSGDGSVVVGEGNTFEAIRWNETEGLVGLGTLPGALSTAWSWARAASTDGSVIVGASNGPASGDLFNEAFVWTETGGMLPIGDLPGGIFNSEAWDVSADGTIVVGVGDDASNQSHAFRWTETGGMADMGTLPGHNFSAAYKISADGSTIVGVSASGSESRAWRWTEVSGMVALSATDNGGARGVSADGSVVVGTSYDVGHAFIWDEFNGMRDLHDLMVNEYGLGPDLGQWVIETATDISDDGFRIIGNAFNDALGLTKGYLLTLPIPIAPPVITANPVVQSTIAGSESTLSVAATGDGLTYQWRFNGEELEGATEATFTIPSTQQYHAGDYSVVVSNGGGSVTSSVANLTVSNPDPSASRLTSLSTRAVCLTGDNLLIPGFVVQGTGTKRLLIRAVGPTLGNHPFNLNGVLPDPVMTLNRWNGVGWDVLVENDNWMENGNAIDISQTASDLSAFELQEDQEAALLWDLPPGQYTVVSSGVGNTTGLAIVELYDADDNPTATMTSISNRGFVGTGNQVMIPGFVISSEGPKTFLIRVVGPTLADAPFGVAGTMDDPQLTVFRRELDGSETKILSNDNWGENPGAANTLQVAQNVSAFSLQDNSADAAIVATLQPGVYTVVASAADGVGTGIVIVEVYAVD